MEWRVSSRCLGEIHVNSEGLEGNDLLSGRCGRSVRLLIYFKTANPELDKLDPAQLAEVIAFRESLPSSGVCYKKFG
jgi:hypothetical protein